MLQSLGCPTMVPLLSAAPNALLLLQVLTLMLMPKPLVLHKPGLMHCLMLCVCDEVEHEKSPGAMLNISQCGATGTCAICPKQQQADSLQV